MDISMAVDIHVYIHVYISLDIHDGDSGIVRPT